MDILSDERRRVEAKARCRMCSGKGWCKRCQGTLYDTYTCTFTIPWRRSEPPLEVTFRHECRCWRERSHAHRRDVEPGLCACCKGDPDHCETCDQLEREGIDFMEQRRRNAERFRPR